MARVKMLTGHLIVAGTMIGLFTAGSGVAYVAASGLVSVGSLVTHR
ncbi:MULTISPECIES: hypothetical protein [Sphingomonas]|jgi:hypothetical protein|nr:MULTISPECIES: hypothetical protein [Sphingomonas]